MAIAKDRGTRRVAEGIGLAERQAAWAPPQPWSRAASRRALSAPPAPPAQSAAGSAADTKAWLTGIARKYMLKVKAEREARLNGQIAAADFYLRQLTFIEVMLDLLGTDGFDVMRAFRKDGYGLIDIAETPFSRVMDLARRTQWQDMGEPVGPLHPPRDLLAQHDGFSTEPTGAIIGSDTLSYKEQEALREEERRQAAEEQLKWEAEARRDYERRRDSDAAS
ncbi:hypothetical protein IC614_07485 [Allosphingosinicella flava]|uniref:Uncharacterized protein n=1 Tax=Allosphingosinicella flava TaxID=2771430 RepID=A0A7T2GHY4_9SPHN|nr:hypothetical protein [Sphingosinicella flava]QPQ54207.1 hypothetical protein IC614_07485 [Sphingosinicella flava]